MREKCLQWPFFMPPAEFKEAYEKMKLGDHSVVYEHGSIGEKDEYFGISIGSRISLKRRCRMVG